MGYFTVRYDSRVVIYDCKNFIRLATGLQFYSFGDYLGNKKISCYLFVVKRMGTMHRHLMK